jgi:hypothetical protein
MQQHIDMKLKVREKTENERVSVKDTNTVVVLTRERAATYFIISIN